MHFIIVAQGLSFLNSELTFKLPMYGWCTVQTPDAWPAFSSQRTRRRGSLEFSAYCRSCWCRWPPIPSINPSIFVLIDCWLPFTLQRTFFCRFLSIGEEKMSPLSKKRGHHDLRILRFGGLASTAAVRTRGDFGSIPSPLSRCCQQYESRTPA